MVEGLPRAIKALTLSMRFLIRIVAQKSIKLLSLDMITASNCIDLWSPSSRRTWHSDHFGAFVALRIRSTNARTQVAPEVLADAAKLVKSCCQPSLHRTPVEMPLTRSAEPGSAVLHPDFSMPSRFRQGNAGLL